MFNALNCLLQRGAHQTSRYYSFKTLWVTYSFLLLCQLITYLDDDGDDEGLCWSSPACSWWPGCCVWMIYRTLHPCSATHSTYSPKKWSRQVHGILSWKLFSTVLWYICYFSSCVQFKPSSLCREVELSSGVAQKPFPLSEICLLCALDACRLVFNLTMLFNISGWPLTWWKCPWEDPHRLNWVSFYIHSLRQKSDVSYHYFFEAVASFSCGFSFVPVTSGCLEIQKEKINLQ